MIYTDEFNSNRTGTGRNKTTRNLGDTGGKYTRVHWKKNQTYFLKIALCNVTVSNLFLLKTTRCTMTFSFQS